MRSANFGQNGAGTTPAEPEFFCVVIQRTFWQLHNERFDQIWSRNVVRCPIAESEKTFENFQFSGHFPQKSEIENRSNRHLTQSRLQVMGCTAERYCLTPRCSPRAREFPRSANFSPRRRVADFGLFFLYKTLKHTFQ